MTEYQRIKFKRYPKLQTNINPEARYWRKFKHQVTVKEYAAVTSIDFCPVLPYDYAISSSARIQIYGVNNNKVKKTISRFKEIAYSGCFREDGQLLVAGDGSGLIQVFDSNSRTVMRTFIGHSRAVHVTKFSSYSQVMSSSDDCTVRCWDLPTGEELISLSGHKDYIRSGDVHSSSPELWLTGSYDHTVKLWDLRSKETTFTMCHGAPVESVLLFPGGVMALSAGGNKIKVWDLLSGGRELYSFSNHQKTITSLAFDSFHRRILSGSLDHHVKIYDASTYKVLHGIKYTAPVLCLASSPTGRHLVVGMSDGCVSIRYRPEIKPPPAPQAPPRGGTHKYIVRGPLAKPKEDDLFIEREKKKILKRYDAFLKKFQYGRALDAALETSKPVVVISVLEELVRRGGIHIALSGRNEKSLIPFLMFLAKHINNPRYSSLLLNLCGVIIDIYSSVIGQSLEIDELIFKIHRKIKLEIEFQKKLFEILGSLDMIMHNSL